MDKNILKDKIDFVAIVEVNDANPNGDPLNGNRPRTSYSGIGEISDVCIKRKIRNRFIDMGLNVFVQSDDKRVDEYCCLSERYKALTTKEKKTQEEAYNEACEIWDDIRPFGATMAFKASDTKANDAVSLGITGAVSIHPAKSVAPVEIISTQITKSVNSEAGDKKGSDTMGMKHRVAHGVYIIKGSISPIQAKRNGYTEEDAENLKKALQTLYWDDASAARPDGSMRVVRLYWFRHTGLGSAYKSHNSIKVKVKENINLPTSIDDYDIVYTPVDGIKCDVIECD